MLPSSERGRVLALHVSCLEQLDRADEAERLIVERMKDEGDDHAFVLAAGMEFSELDGFAHAEMFLRNLCDLVPDDAVPWYNLAVTLGREGRYAESAAMYGESVRRQPDMADAHFQQAYCLSLIEDYEGAAKAYRRYLTLEPEDGEAWQGLAVAESNRNAFDEAYEAFRKAVALNSEPDEAYYNWAVTAVRRKDAEQVAACVAALQEIDPEGWRTLLVRADKDEMQGDIWPAWELLNEAFEAVLDDEVEENADPGLRAYVAATLLRFAQRHDLGDHADEVIEAVFQNRVFGDEALEAIRQFEARYANQVRSYQVVLEVEPEKADRYYVVYGVAATSDEEAKDLAEGFQMRCEADTISVWAMHVLSPPDEGAVGVYWRSEELTAPPGVGEPV
jgi:tetratricopeptide (TPR) repeat protein